MQSTIDLTNVAVLEVLNRIYYGSTKSKAFFVNKVKLLKRFEGKIDTDGDDAMFQCYDGMTLNASAVEFVNDWALKLPECYEGCEIDQYNPTQLVINFGMYEQLDPGEYLLKNVVKENVIYSGKDDLYLDVSMSIIDVNNITKIKLILDKIKYFISEEGEQEEDFGLFIDKFRLNIIYVLFNDNGFVGTKRFNYKDLTDRNFKVEIRKSYIIGGNNGLKNSIRMVEPLKNVFMIYNDKKCIALKCMITCEYNLYNFDYRITNVIEEYNFYEINLLVAG